MATNKTELITIVDTELSSLVDELTTNEISRGVDKAMNELGYSFPVTGVSENWAVDRSKRHIIEVLLLNEGPSFRFKKLALEQPFDHYKSLIEYWDEQYEKALESYPELFPNALVPNGVSLSALFGTVTKNNHRYAVTGKDVSYLYDNVDFVPSDD